MKQLLTVTQSKKFLFSLTLGLIAIWLIGPYIAIAGNVPLAHFSYRILASIIACLFFLLMEYQRNENPIANELKIPEEVQHELQVLHQTIKSVLLTLYKNTIKSFLLRYQKPWYLVLGPQNAGKSTLLNKAELNIKGLDNLPPMMITPTKFFNWWLADDAVFIDVGGKYLRDGREDNNTELLFQGFFKILKRFRRYKPINGLILTINLQELTVNTKDQAQLKRLQQIIKQLVVQFVSFPIYLIITRCDTVAGFTEFFEDLGPEERSQVFGISFPITNQPQSLPQLFNEQYNALLTRLNERILWRINKEHNLDKIGKIKNFPLQMEFLKSPLAKLLNVLLPNTHLNLRGIFFTSSFQKDTPFDNLTASLTRAYDIQHLQSGPRPNLSKNFFITGIFKRIIFPEAKFYSSTNEDHQLNQFASLFIIVITAICIFIFFSSYRYNQAIIRNTQQAIQYVKSQSKPGVDPLINQLNVLETAIDELANYTAPWYRKLGMQQAHKISNNAEKIYSKLLTTKFLNYLQQTIEIQLQNTQPENSNQLYATLKAYLMLGDHKHLDKKYLSNWFNNYWHQLDDNSNQAKLNRHLNNLFSHNFKEVSLTPELIENKRVVLNSVPQSRLVLAILQNRYQRAPVQIMQGSTKAFNNLPVEIPGIYNIVNFRNVYYSEILNTCKEITNGDWVLGKKALSGFSDIMLNQLANEVKAIYLNEYVVVWSDILSKVKIDEFRDLNQIIAFIDLLNDPQSPLVTLINIIKNNTQPISDSIEFTQQVSTRFLALNALSENVLKNTNQSSLLAVKLYLTKVANASDIDKASYDAASVRMENTNTIDAISALLQQSHVLPEPLQTWHTMIAAESWRLILKYTQNYLNKVWIASVYPQYAAMLDKRYPLFKESATDISLNDFASFFGNGGTMDIFFKNYLQPFVDNSRLYWEWKSVDGQRINIPQPTLEMFIRAALIQKMFFPEESRSAAITFSLVPVELDANVQNFALDLEGQPLMFQKDNEQIISLSWPGPQPNHTQITFTDIQGKKSTLAETGPWSWFKILDKSHLESTSSPKHFRLTFNLDGNAVHYELYTNGIVNPFIPGILNTFRCPENL